MTPDSAQRSPADQRSTSAPSGTFLLTPSVDAAPSRPPNITHISFPTYESPLRHHQRKPSTPRQVKETLHAHSEYTNSEDDGAAIHRINQYVIKQEVGRGSFGAVHLAVDQYGTEYAVKEFSKSRLRKRAQSSILRRPHGPRLSGHMAAGIGFNSPLHRRAASDIHKDEEGGNPLYLIREEIAIMKKLNHSNLVSLFEVLDDPSEDSLYMVLEICKKGVVMKVGMHEPAEPYDPERCRCWFRDLILGIEYLHAQGVVHRDIKPDNLLLTEDDVLKISDFGVSEMFAKDSDLMTAKSAGSPAFLPPELCVSRHGSISGKAADIWSMGVTLYCLYFGRVPFEKVGVLDLYEAIRNDDVDLQDCEEENFVSLMQQLLEKDPNKRIKMEKLREHPWVTKGGHDPLLSAEENTSDLVEPPTEEEMRRAITGNLSNLLVVMKAVKKFKGLLSKKRPEMLDSILGQETRIFQPPLSMSRKATAEEQWRHKSHSVDTHDRKPIEQALAREGVHRAINFEKINYDLTERDDTAVSGRSVVKPSPSPHPDKTHVSPPPSIDGPSSPSPTDTRFRSASQPLRSLDEHRIWGKGQAHDPLTDDFHFLAIGPSSTAALPDDPTSPTIVPTVSESPSAAEGNIYETAYHEEVERIRRNSESATLYLTRRVKNTEKYRGDSNMRGIDEKHAAGNTGWSKILHLAKGDGEAQETKGEGRAKEDKPTTEAGLKRLVEAKIQEGKLHARENGGAFKPKSDITEDG